MKILSIRIAHAKKLLLETDLKAHEIAYETGFSSIVIHYLPGFPSGNGLSAESFFAANTTLEFEFSSVPFTPQTPVLLGFFAPTEDRQFY